MIAALWASNSIHPLAWTSTETCCLGDQHLTREDSYQLEYGSFAPPRKGPLPSIFGYSGGGLFIVSEALKTLLQGLETVHDFSRLEIIREARGNPFPDIYWLLLSVPEVDAVIANFTDFDGPYLKARARCTLSADAIRGRHFWRGISRLSTTYFCSDEFRNGVRDLRLDGFDIRHKCEVR